LKILGTAIAGVATLSFCAALAGAQERLDAFFAMGTARDGSTNQLIDLLGTGYPMPTGAMDGLYGTVGGGLMITPSLGVGGQVCFRFAQGDYSNAGYRPVFYDFNGIWAPTLGTESLMLEFQGGLGGVNMRFYGVEEWYDYYSGTYTNYAGSMNHFQLHAGLGVRVYITDTIFLRPTVDYHWVRNFTEFERNSVLRFGVAIGLSSYR